MIVSVNQTAADRLDSLPAAVFLLCERQDSSLPFLQILLAFSSRACALLYIILYFTPLSFTILYSSLLYFAADCQYFSQKFQHLNEKRQQLHQKK